MSDKIALLALIVAITAGVGSWLAIPAVQKWVRRRKRSAVCAAILLVGASGLWLFKTQTIVQSKPLNPLPAVELPPAKASSPPVLIQQKSDNSPCSNIAGTGNVSVDCSPTEKKFEPKKKR